MDWFDSRPKLLNTQNQIIIKTVKEYKDDWDKVMVFPVNNPGNCITFSRLDCVHTSLVKDETSFLR